MLCHYFLGVGQYRFDYVISYLPRMSNCMQTSGTTESSYRQLSIKNNQSPVRLWFTFTLGAKSRCSTSTTILAGHYVLIPEFGHSTRTRVQGRHPVLGQYIVLVSLKCPMSESNTILFHCAGTSARTPSVNTGYVRT